MIIFLLFIAGLLTLGTAYLYFTNKIEAHLAIKAQAAALVINLIALTGAFLQ